MDINIDPVVRLVKGVPSQQVMKDLSAISKQFELNDVGLAVDLYFMVKRRGKGLLPADKIGWAARRLKSEQGGSYKAWRERCDRQYKVLATFKKTKFFARIGVSDPLTAVEKILAIMRELEHKDRPSICGVCPLLQNCQFGMQFFPRHHGQNNYLAQYNQVAAIDWNLPFPPECPNPPVHQGVQRMQRMVNVIQAIFDPVAAAYLAAQLAAAGDKDASATVMALAGLTSPNNAQPAATANVLTQSGGGDPAKGVVQGQIDSAGPSKEFDTTFTGSHMFDAVERMVKSLTSKQMAVLELNSAFKEMMDKEKGKKRLESQTPQDDMSIVETSEASKTLKALPSELAKDDDEFYGALAAGELRIKEHEKREDKKNLLYILLDVSGSMRSIIDPNAYALVTRANLASALCLALIRKTIDDQAIMFFRFFAGCPNRLRICRTKDELIDLSRMVGLGDYNGGGTDIADALQTGSKDILSGLEKNIRKADLVLISDGESNVSHLDFKKMLGGTKLHVLDVHGIHGDAMDSDREALKKNATGFHEIDPNNLDLRKVVKAVV